ncbi:MAG: hypothetical protein HPY85_05420 [Anaerolineae bacterium]|nr:hypothetical protein [Anaerolineae bacterium]
MSINPNLNAVPAANLPSSTKLSLQTWMILVVLVAGFLRFYQLGQSPLDNGEALIALDAINTGEIRGDTLPTLITSVLFWFMEDSNGLARAASALAGTCLVLIPLGFRKYLDDIGVIILAAGLALEPSLVAMSRMADGRIFSVLFFCAAAMFLVHQRYLLTGMCLGIFLLSGKSVGFIGILLLLTCVWTWIAEGRGSNWLHDMKQKGTPGLLPGLVLAFFMVGSLFGLRVNGISAAAAGWLEFFKGWININGNSSIPESGIALLVYGFLPLMLGVWGMVLALKRKEHLLLTRFLVRWLVIALGIYMLYPGRQTSDLIWILLPLWWFTAYFGSRIQFKREDWNWVNAGSGAFLFVLLCFSHLNWAGALNDTYDPQKVILRWAVIGGSVLLILLLFVFIGYGWGTRQSIVSGTTAIVVYLLVFQLAGGSWKSTGNGPGGIGVELWQAESNPAQLELMITTLDQLGEFSHGDSQFLEVVLVGLGDEPALVWGLRNFVLEQRSAFLPGQSPEVVITRSTEGETWGDSYRGQDFVYRERVNWSLLYPEEWQSWILHRSVPKEQEWILLWARTDLFPGEVIESNSEQTLID